MSPQLVARQLAAGACAVTVATISQARTYRAFGVSAVILANELVDAAGLRWLAAELDADPDFDLMCWVDSVRGVELMTAALTAAGLRRPRRRVRRGGHGRRSHRLPRRGPTSTRWPGPPSASPRLRLVGVAGYEAALGHDVTPDAAGARPGLSRGDAVGGAAAGRRCSRPTTSSSPRAAARTSTLSPTMLTGWPGGLAVRTMLRSGCYLTHDDGLYRAHVAAARSGCARAERVGAGDVAAGSRPGVADDGPPRRVVRPGPARAAAACPTAR